MSDMIEVVARKLASRRYSHCGGPDAETLVKGKPNWKFCVEDATLAIEAMREPTDETCRAVDIALHEFEPKWGPIVRTSISLCVLEAFFDAALSQDTHSLPNSSPGAANAGIGAPPPSDAGTNSEAQP